MDKYLERYSNIYRKLQYVKRNLSRRRDLEYLYKQDDDGKKHFMYNDLLEEMDNEHLNLSRRRIKNWLSICSAPGFYDEYLHQHTKAKGTGITLGVKEGGLEFTKKIPDFKVIYRDIMKERYNARTKFNFIITGCLDMNLDKKNRYYNVMLSMSSMLLGLENLKKGGIFALKTSLKNFNLLSNIIYIFQQLFGEVRTFKSTKVLQHRSVCYVIGINYKAPGKDNEQLTMLRDLYEAYHKNRRHELETLMNRTVFDTREDGRDVERLLNPVMRTQIRLINNILYQ